MGSRLTELPPFKSEARWWQETNRDLSAMDELCRQVLLRLDELDW